VHVLSGDPLALALSRESSQAAGSGFNQQPRGGAEAPQNRINVLIHISDDVRKNQCLGAVHGVCFIYQ
jgi:hypothetical protein